MNSAQIDDILFWLGSQDREHMLFFKLGIDPDSGKEFKQEADRLYTAYDQAVRTQDIQALLRLSGPSQSLKRAAYVVSQQKWIGWLFPLFYDHTRREIDYALTRIERQLTPQQEICFWTQIGAEHAQMAAQLLDPTEADAMHHAMMQAGALNSLHASCANQIMPSMLALTAQAASDLDNFFSYAEKARLKSIIHPALSAHIVREGKRFVQTMQSLKSPLGGMG